MSVFILAFTVMGCAGPTTASVQSTERSESGHQQGLDFRVPDGESPDYQLGGEYTPQANVDIVVRDRSALPADGAYSICYVNAFQTQPGERDEWPEETLLRSGGVPVIDPDWPDEALLDTSTDAKRQSILDVVIPWISDCADAGFEGVEFDNLDTFTRSDGALNLEDNLTLAQALVTVAHEVGLAAGQKNSAEQTSVLEDVAGFDFAVAEECAAYKECTAYTDTYHERVIDIEYSDELPRPFAEMCDDPDSPRTMVLRDRELVTPEHPAYVFETCAD